MHYRRLGRTGRLPRPFGTNAVWLEADECVVAVMEFVAAGGTLIDSADVYSRWHPGNPGGVSEEIIGRWIARARQSRRNRPGTKARGRMWEGPNGEGLAAHTLYAPATIACAGSRPTTSICTRRIRSTPRRRSRRP